MVSEDEQRSGLVSSLKSQFCFRIWLHIRTEEFSGVQFSCLLVVTFTVD